MKALTDTKTIVVTNAAGEFSRQLQTIGIMLDVPTIAALNKDPLFEENSEYFKQSLLAYKAGDITREQGECLGFLLINHTGLSVPAIQFAGMLSQMGVMLDMQSLQDMSASPRFREHSTDYLKSLEAYKKGTLSGAQSSSLSPLLHEVTGLNLLTIEFAKRLSQIGIMMDRAELAELDHEQRFMPISHSTIYFTKKLLQIGIMMDREVLADLDDKKSSFREHEFHYLACTKSFDMQRKTIGDGHAGLQIANLLYSLRQNNQYSDKVMALIPPYVPPVDPQPASFVARLRPKTPHKMALVTDAATRHSLHISSISSSPPPQKEQSWTEQLLSYMPISVQSFASSIGLSSSPSPSPPVQRRNGR